MGVPKPPDLWIHHDQMELKNIDKGLHSATPVCSDNASSSGALTLPRSVVHSEYEGDTQVPAHVTNSLDKRAYVAGYMSESNQMELICNQILMLHSFANQQPPQ